MSIELLHVFWSNYQSDTQQNNLQQAPEYEEVASDLHRHPAGVSVVEDDQEYEEPVVSRTADDSSSPLYENIPSQSAGHAAGHIELAPVSGVSQLYEGISGGHTQTDAHIYTSLSD